MKKLFIFILLAITTTISAQNSIYYDVLSEDTEIGIGRTNKQIILSVISTTKGSFKISFEDQFGTEYLNSKEFKVDTIAEYKIGKRKVKEYDWVLTPKQLAIIYNRVNSSDIVKINKEEFSATVIVAVLQKLEKYNMPNMPRMRFFGIRSFFK